MSTIPPLPPPIAQRLYQSESMGTGCVVQGLGLVGGPIAGAILAPYLGVFAWVIGAGLAIVLLVKGSSMAKFCLCGACRNRLASRHVTVCPACRAQLR